MNTITRIIDSEKAELEKQHSATQQQMRELQARAALNAEILATVTEVGMHFSGFMHGISVLIGRDPLLARRILSGLAAEIDSQLVQVPQEQPPAPESHQRLGVSPFVMGLLGGLAKARQLPTSFEQALQISYRERAQTVMRQGYKEGLRTSVDNLRTLHANPSLPALTPMRNLMHSLLDAFADQGGIDAVFTTADGWLKQLDKQQVIGE